MKYKIGIIGSASCEDRNILKKAREIGKEVAYQDCFLLTGGTTGVSYEAVKGAKENNGLTLGFSPAIDIKEHKELYNLPTNFDILIFSGFGLKGRNVLLIRSIDCVIAISGQVGTLNEVTIAYDEKKPIGLLKGTGGLCDNKEIINFLRKKNRRKGSIMINDNPKELVREIIKQLKNINKFH
jgi:uncharacterized protein (TIGR00725 family)